MEYGEILYRGRWIYIPGIKKFCQFFRFRMDPVPFIFRFRGGNWNRRLSTTQEKKMYYAHIGQCGIRCKRKPKNLPDTWDEYPRGDLFIKKSWKKRKKKKQYMKG